MNIKLKKLKPRVTLEQFQALSKLERELKDAGQVIASRKLLQRFEEDRLMLRARRDSKASACLGLKEKD